MKRYFLLTMMAILSFLSVFAWSDGDIVAIYYSGKNFLGANESAPAAITSSGADTPPTIYYLWQVEASGSQWKFKNLGTGTYLSVTTSGSNVNLRLNASAALFYYTSSTATSGKLYYKYKSKNYYLRYNGGYEMKTTNSLNVLSFNRFTYGESASVATTPPNDIEWGLEDLRRDKSSSFSIYIVKSNEYQGVDVTTQIVFVSKEEITDRTVLMGPGYNLGVVYELKSISGATTTSTVEKPDGSYGLTSNVIIGAVEINTIDGTIQQVLWNDPDIPHENYVDSVIITWQFPDLGFSGRWAVAVIVDRFFVDDVNEMELEVVPGSYTFAATEATAGLDYGWKQEFEIKRKLTRGTRLLYANGTEYTNKVETKYLDDLIWPKWVYDPVTDAYVILNPDTDVPTCIACSCDVVLTDGTHFEPTDTYVGNTFYIKPTASNTSGSSYSDVIHVKYRYEHYGSADGGYDDGSLIGAYPKPYPDPDPPCDLPACGYEPVEPDPYETAKYTGPDDPSYITDYGLWESEHAEWVSCHSAYMVCEAENDAYYAEYGASLFDDEYYIHAYIDISQLNTASMSASDRYVSQKGASNRDFMTMSDGRNIQSVHESKGVMYCIPGEDSRLLLRGKDFFGWMRWFDYNRGYSLTTLYGNQLWNTKPNGTASGKAYEFVNIGNEKSTLSRGQYYAYGHSPFPSAQPSFNVPVVSIPSQSVLDAQEAAGKALLPMDVACDVSNYTDFSFSTVGGVNMITGPTLSFRQVFQLRHADEMDARLNAHRYAGRTDLSKDPDWKNNDEGNYMSDDYLEEHVCIAPAGRNISLTTDYKYKYSSHDSELGYIYKSASSGSGGTSSYNRIGKSGVSEVAEWYKNGEKAVLGTSESSDDATQIGYVNTSTCFLVLNPHVMPTGKTVDTVVYTLATKSYKIARYVVIYQPLTVVGPLVESGSPATAIITDYDIENKYEVLARCTFDPPLNASDDKTKPDGNGNPYTKPGSTDYRVYNVPLAWDECSYGFCYSRPKIKDSHDRRNTASADTQYGEKNQRITGGDVGGGIFPYWGEYMLINKLHESLNGGYIINTIEQHGGAANGYMLYCDGTEEPGLVASLNVTSELCAGQKLYCSAWINNVTKNYSSKSELPKFRFVVEGKFANSSTWNVVTEYLSGDLGHKSGWCQVVFPIDLHISYDEYRIRIYNFANTSIGNDFAIDDIRIYATPLAVTAYQTSTSCTPSDGFSGVDVKAMIRVDYLGLLDDSFFDHDIYYQVYDNTISKPLDAAYIGGGKKYGKFHFPVKNYNHAVSDPTHCFTSLEKFVDAHNEDPSVKYGWVWEHIKDEQRYVLYLSADIDPAAIPAWKSYDDVVIYMATKPADFGSSDCSMSTTLPLKDKLEVHINDVRACDMRDDVDDLDACYYCPNLRYKLEMKVRDYNVDNASIIDAEGRCLNDWLIISSDFSYTRDERIGSKKVTGKGDIFKLNHFGYTYKQVVQAILDMRREPTTEVPNANVFATSYDQLVPEDFLDPVNWGIISTLIQKGMLMIGKQYINAYLPESGLDFMVFPICGTAREVNKTTHAFIVPDKPMNICFSPQRVVMKSWDSQLKFHLGRKAYDDYTLEERINPFVQRVSRVRLEEDARTIDVPLHDYKFVDIVNVELESSDDPDFDPSTHWFGLEADKRYPSNYAEDGDVIKFNKVTTPPAGKTRYNKWKSGKQYIFCITWRDRNDDRNIHLPSTNPEPQHTGAVLNCRPGFSFVSVCVVPDTMVWTPAPNMGESWFVDKNWQEADKTTGAAIGPGFIPLADTHVIIPKNEDERYPNINPGSDPEKIPEAKKILIQDSALIMGQDLLNYEVALVDMTVPSARWTIISPALKGIYSGDMYIPTGSDNTLFVPKTLNDNRSAFPFWQSFYNTQVVQENFNPLNNITLYNSAWGPFANTLTAKYLPGTGYALLGFDDTDEEGHKLQIRLPKQETQYDYFVRPYPGEPAVPSGRVAVLDRTETGRFAYTPGTITITNHEAGRMFVFGNPTMAMINMKLFLKKNPHLQPKFYYYDNGSLNVYTEITSATTNEYLLPPMRGVIVLLKAAQPASTTLDVLLDNSMLTTTTDDEVPVLHAPGRVRGSAAPSLLYLTASNGSNSSSLVVGEMQSAVNEYGEEDAQLLTAGAGTTFKSTALNTIINLYSACGNEALSIDLRNKMAVVPVGLYFPNLKERHDKTDILFNGLSTWDRPLYFYDANTDTEIEIQDGMELTVETPENEELRYYIMTGTQQEQQHTDIATDVNIGNDVQREDATIDFVTITKGQLMILGSDNIDNVQVFDAVGKLVTTKSGNSRIMNITLPQGVYVAKAQSGLTVKNSCVIIK